MEKKLPENRLKWSQPIFLPASLCVFQMTANFTADANRLKILSLLPILPIYYFSQQSRLQKILYDDVEFFKPRWEAVPEVTDAQQNLGDLEQILDFQSKQFYVVECGKNWFLINRESICNLKINAKAEADELQRLVILYNR